MNKRIFVALEARLIGQQYYEDAVKKVKASAKKRSTDIKWVPAENHHITLFFMGSVEEEKLDEISHHIHEVSEMFSPFTLKIKGMDAFPSQLSSRVIYIGVQSKKVLHSLHEELQNRLQIYCEREEPELEYHPHLTIGRIKNACSTKDLISPFQRRSFEKLRVEKMYLYESKVNNYSPHYKKIREYAFSRIEDENED